MRIHDNGSCLQIYTKLTSRQCNPTASFFASSFSAEWQQFGCIFFFILFCSLSVFLSFSLSFAFVSLAISCRQFVTVFIVKIHLILLIFVETLMLFRVTAWIRRLPVSVVASATNANWTKNFNIYFLTLFFSLFFFFLSICKLHYLINSVSSGCVWMVNLLWFILKFTFHTLDGRNIITKLVECQDLK